MKTEILDNYIEVTTEAIKFVNEWVYPHGSLTLKHYGVEVGENIAKRVYELNPKAIKTEIYNNSTAADLKDNALIFANILESDGAIELFKCYQLDNGSWFNYEVAYHERIERMQNNGLLTNEEAKAIASCIDNIVTYVYQNTEELVKIFKEDFGLKECADNGADTEKEASKKHSTLKKADTDEERSINEEKLKEYFVATFKGAGKENPNYFENYLIGDIKEVKSAIGAARMALLIYESDKMIKTQKPNTFIKWYKLFCKMTGCTYNHNYKKSKLDTDKMKLKLYYLYQ